jgi:hypothetical protein
MTRAVQGVENEGKEREMKIQLLVQPFNVRCQLKIV